MDPLTEANGHDLSAIETAKLDNLESVIAGGIQAAADVWRSLRQIRDERLYRATHQTFEDYCQERWDMSKSYANMLVSAGEAMASIESELATTGCQTLPQNERQVRPLTRLPAGDRASAWKEAVESSPSGKPTAAIVEKVVASRLPAGATDDEPPKPKEESYAEREAREFIDQFNETLSRITDGGVYTLASLSKAAGISQTSINWFVRMCDVCPSVTVHRTTGRKGVIQYSFVKSECVTAHSRIRQLAEQIASDSAISGSRAQTAAKRILALLGG